MTWYSTRELNPDDDEVVTVAYARPAMRGGTWYEVHTDIVYREGMTGANWRDGSHIMDTPDWWTDEDCFT